MKANVKNCLITLARNLEGLFLQQAMCINKAIGVVVKSISTCFQRERPNRSYVRVSHKPVKKWRASKGKRNTLCIAGATV